MVPNQFPKSLLCVKVEPSEVTILSVFLTQFEFSRRLVRFFDEEVNAGGYSGNGRHAAANVKKLFFSNRHS
jgi:hypothetical protein